MSSRYCNGREGMLQELLDCLSLSRPAKLLIVIGSLERGGAETHVARTFPQLSTAKYRVEILALGARGPLAENLERDGIRVRSPWLPFRGRGSRPLRAVRLIIVTGFVFWQLVVMRPRIVHFFLPESYLLGGPIAIIGGIKRRIMSRRSLNAYQSKYPPIVARLERALHRRMTAILGNSAGVVRQLLTDEDAPPDRTLLIYNGIDCSPMVPDQERAKMRKTLGLDGNVVVATIVANLIPYKGHADLLDACARLSTDPRWVVLVIGNDSAQIRQSLEALSVDLGVADRVRFLGARSDIQQILAASDLGILCSHEEGFSNAILEYMTAGLPVIATRVGGNPEAVIDGETGLTVPPRAPDQLADALRRLIGDAEERKRMGAAGRKRVVEQFSLGACVARYERVYDAVLSSGSVASLHQLRLSNTASHAA